MASITLDTVFLSLASDLSQVLILEVPEIKDTDALSGEVRAYANGRRRSVTRAGSTRVVPLAPDWVSVADIATLRSWRGKTVLLRDSYGRKMWSVFYAVEVDEYLIAGASKAAITLTEITYSEVV